EPAATRPEARIALRELLTQELAYVSRDALIDGLGKQQQIEDCILSLVMLVDLLDRKDETLRRRDETLQAIVQALRERHKRSGARLTLVRLGQLAAKPVCDLLEEKDNEINEEARSILAEMGETALPSIYKLAHEPQRTRDAENIFMRMTGPLTAK